jgi:ABC-type maltose transport system permease subunit
MRDGATMALPITFVVAAAYAASRFFFSAGRRGRRLAEDVPEVFYFL